MLVGDHQLGPLLCLSGSSQRKSFKYILLFFFILFLRLSLWQLSVQLCLISIQAHEMKWNMAIHNIFFSWLILCLHMYSCLSVLSPIDPDSCSFFSRIIQGDVTYNYIFNDPSKQTVTNQGQVSAPRNRTWANHRSVRTENLLLKQL